MGWPTNEADIQQIFMFVYIFTYTHILVCIYFGLHGQVLCHRKTEKCFNGTSSDVLLSVFFLTSSIQLPYFLLTFRIS